MDFVRQVWVVTLKDLRELVMSDVNFVIQDRRNQTDLTYPTLLNLLGDGNPILSREFLLNAIRDQSRAARPRVDEAQVDAAQAA